MQPYKILITCAGTGSRLEKFTEHRNKALITLGEKPAITHLLEKFDSTLEFVIAVGYKKHSLVEYLKQAHPDLSFTFVDIENYEGNGSGLGHTFRCCSEHLQTPFIFISNDTVVNNEVIDLNPNELGNWIGIYDNSKEDTDPSAYRCAEVSEGVALNILAKDHNTNDIYIGLCGIADYKTFWEKMFESDSAITIGEVYGLNCLPGKQAIYFDEWYDTGNLRSLKLSDMVFKSDKHNILPKISEAIWFLDNRCIKYHDDKRFISERLTRASCLPKNLLPRILDRSSNHFIYEYVHGDLLSHKHDLEIYLNFMDNMNHYLWSQTPDQMPDYVHLQKQFYREKTLSRVKHFFDLYDEVDQAITINGKKVAPLQESLQSIQWDRFYDDAHFSWFHGDLHGENVIVTNDNSFKLLDWRQNFCSGNFQFGDAYYDLGKILHGLIVRHTFVNDDQYDVTHLGEYCVNIDIRNSFSYSKIYENLRKWIKDHHYNLERVDLIVALIFINIAGLHHYPYSKFLMLLGRYLLEDCKEYIEGTIYVKR